MLCDGLENLVAGVGLQLAEVTQVPVVQCWDDLGPYLPTYHAISEGEDIQGVGTFLPAKETNREREESVLTMYEALIENKHHTNVCEILVTRNWAATVTLLRSCLNSQLPHFLGAGCSVPWCYC